jgi:uncharacterized protein (DUF1697 family)
MPGTHVALLRGINVGRAKRISMAELRAFVESLGYADVKTLLNSGNVVLTRRGKGARDPGPAIEKGLAEAVGVKARVVALTAEELATVVAENPLVEVADDPSRLMVAVLLDRADRAKVVPLLKQDWGTDSLALGSLAAYVWCPGGILESKLFGALDKALGGGITTRNWATMTKLQALVTGA